jgi:PKD repeat protein
MRPQLDMSRGATQNRGAPVLILAALCAALLLVLFPGSAPAAPVDVDVPGEIVVETFGVSLPNDPNRCVAVSFVEFAPIPGGTAYTAVVANTVLGGTHQTFSTAPPYASDHYTISVGGVQHTFDAPGGKHWIGPLGSSSTGQGCESARAGEAAAFSLVSLTTRLASEPPTAAFTWAPEAGHPLTVDFDGSGSTDDGQVVDWQWDFGDGTTGSGATPQHTYQEHGTYNVELTVTDDSALAGSTTKAVLVNAPPQADFSWTVSPGGSLSIDFDGSASSDDSRIASYDWAFGDGQVGNGQTTSHGYAGAGSLPVTLTVTDEDGATDDATILVTVQGQGGYRVELGRVEGEDADLILDKDKKVVGVECSLGSFISGLGSSPGAGAMLDAIGLDPKCLNGILSLDTGPLSSMGSGLLNNIKGAFDSAKLFPNSPGSQGFNKLTNATGFDKLSDSVGGLAAAVAKLKLPPAGNQIIDVTPPAKEATKIENKLGNLGDLLQNTVQSANALYTELQDGIKTLLP